MPSIRTSRLTFGFVGATLVVAGAVFAADVFTPLGRAVPVLYVGLILLSRTSRWPPYALILGVLATFLTLVGYFLSPGDPAETALTDRAIAALMIWVTTFLCFQHTQLAAELSEARRRLERDVEDLENKAARVTTALADEQASHKQTEGELEETEQRYEAVFNQTFQIAAILSRHGILERANETLLSLGRLRPQDVKGRPLWETSIFNRQPGTQDTLRSAVAAAAAGNFYRDELSFDRIDGERMIADFSMKPIRDEAGEVEYLLFEARDITDYRHTQEIASQKQRLEVIGTLASGIAHDFNNLLTVVGGNIELAARRIKHNPAVQKRFEIALKAVFEGKALTQRLLAIARKQELSPRAVKIKGVIDTVVELLDRTLPDTITIDSNFSGDLWDCWADPTQLQAAVMNLVVNGRDAMPKGGQILIRCSNVSIDEIADDEQLTVGAGDFVRIDVVDQGEGIPSEMLNRVTEPFFTTKPSGEGSGLGLSMVYGFVQQSGGAMLISSEIGVGTTVSLLLPHAIAAVEADETRTQTAQVKGRILVLEDNDEVREVIVSMLSDLGHAVEQAADGTAALDQLRANGPFDLLLSDVMIPGSVTVHEVARTGRSLNSRLKMLFSSADRGKAEDLLKSKEHDAEFIAKPYQYGELSNRVAALLSEGSDATSESS